MPYRHAVCVGTRIPTGADPDEFTEAEATWWGTFGTVIEQRPDRTTGSLLTFVKVGDAGRRALEGSLRTRPPSRLVVGAQPSPRKDPA